MEKEPSHVTERILNLTLEIVYLLTGENYITFKISDGLVGSSDMETFKRSNKVQEVTSEIAELLTGENYMTFKLSEGLVASNLRKTVESPSYSMRQNKKVQEVIGEIIKLLAREEKQYLKGQKDLYKDALMDNSPPLTLPDELSYGSSPERCHSPPYSRDAIRLRTQQAVLDENEIDSGVKAKTNAEELYLGGDELCKEEEMVSETSTEPGDTSYSCRDVKAEEEEEELHVVVKEEEIPVEIGTDGKPSLGKHRVPLENPTTPTLLLLLPSGDVSSNPSSHFPNSSAPIVHHPSARGGETFRCPECGDCFSKKELLMSHKSTHLKPSSESGQEHPKKLYVIEHELIPMKPYSCSECGKCFTQKGHVVLHQRTHTGEKPYSCSECGKGFPAKSALSKHKRMHTGEKPFSCSECGKSFSFNSALTKHKKTHTGEKPYSCSDCGRCFSQRDHLIAHQKTHTGEKPFSCSECGKSFAKKGNLETHQTIHTGDRPYSCSICGKGFRSKSNLLRHKKVHRGLRPHACSECGKQFKSEFTLSLHLRSHETIGITLVGCSN